MGRRGAAMLKPFDPGEFVMTVCWAALTPFGHVVMACVAGFVAVDRSYRLGETASTAATGDVR